MLLPLLHPPPPGGFLPVPGKRLRVNQDHDLPAQPPQLRRRLALDLRGDHPVRLQSVRVGQVPGDLGNGGHPGRGDHPSAEQRQAIGEPPLGRLGPVQVLLRVRAGHVPLARQLLTGELTDRRHLAVRAVLGAAPRELRTSPTTPPRAGPGRAAPPGPPPGPRRSQPSGPQRTPQNRNHRPVRLVLAHSFSPPSGCATCKVHLFEHENQEFLAVQAIRFEFSYGTYQTFAHSPEKRGVIDQREADGPARSRPTR
jgi:hypothetical protein